MLKIRQTLFIAALGLPLAPLAARAEMVTVGDYDSCVALVASDAKKALDYARKWKPNAGAETTAALHCEALALSALGRDAEAATTFSQVALNMGDAPKEAQAEAFAQAASAWVLAEDLARARTAIDQALALDPTSEHLIARANIRAMAKDWEGVRVDAGEVLVELPTSVEALTLRAAALRNLGYPHAALADAERAVSIAPHNLSALLERGRMRAAQGNVAGARSDWEDVVRFAKEMGRVDDPSAEAARDYLKAGAPK
jgi:tetratricopeptide (TPR) repeat protein